VAKKLDFRIREEDPGLLPMQNNNQNNAATSSLT
jgi:hypothetical protein